MKNILLVTFLIVKCFVLQGQPCSAETIEIRNIKASNTDSNISLELQNHQVYINQACNSKNKLVLHLVGSIDNPANTTFFPTLAANNGFKVISLKYPNGVSAKRACSNSSDPDCFWKYRQEIIFGTDTSSEVSVDRNNCIINRLLKLLIHLDNVYPSENWNRFLADAESINWSDMVLSGHSQGGGHAAFLAKQFEVSGVLMFASPNDFSNSFSSPASWINSTSATPDSLYYALGNLYDDVVNYNQQYQVWEMMNLLDVYDSTFVDISSGAYNNSRVLYIKDTSSAILSGNHNAMIIDKFTPVSLGVPRLAPVWKYMLGLREVTTSIPNIEDSALDVEVFPNPTTNKLFVKSRENVSKVEIYNSVGNRMKIFLPGSKDFAVNLQLYEGIIFIKLTTINFKSTMKKVVVN